MRTCTVDGCDRVHRAKGYCASHYNSILAPDRHRTELVCEECGTAHVTTRTNGRYCSMVCAKARVKAATAARKAEAQAVRDARPVRVATPKAPSFAPEVRVCTWCGEDYRAVRADNAYCTERCARKAAKRRRRAREVGATGTYTWSEVARLYVRLGGCAYCHLPTTDLEPDHVIPLSKGGSNSITNVVPACRSCNSDKRDLTLADWYVDRARRGLSVVVLDPRLTHLTHALLAA